MQVALLILVTKVKMIFQTAFLRLEGRLKIFMQQPDQVIFPLRLDIA